MNNTPTRRGGRRPGAGRPSSSGGRTERLSVRLSPRVASRLRESGRAGELIEAVFDFGDSNQNGLALSWLARFARIGSMRWRDDNGGDDLRIDDIPLGLSSAELLENWTRWFDYGDEIHSAAIEEAYRQYEPLARHVREVLLNANPLLTEADLRSWKPGSINVRTTINLLHGYALIVNDAHLPCGGRSLVAFMRGDDGNDEGAQQTSYWISSALSAGRPDVAVAFGAGDYAVTGEAAVLEHLRKDLRIDTALAWWKRNPEFCRRIDPCIEILAGIPEFPELAKLADKLAFFGSFFGVGPDWEALKNFRNAWWHLTGKHGDDVLLHLLERFGVLRADTVRRRLAIEIPGERTEDHAILGVRPGACRQTINAAYRKLAQRHHPDKGGSHAEFVRIKQARDRLISETESV